MGRRGKSSRPHSVFPRGSPPVHTRLRCSCCLRLGPGPLQLGAPGVSESDAPLSSPGARGTAPQSLQPILAVALAGRALIPGDRVEAYAEPPPGAQSGVLRGGEVAVPILQMWTLRPAKTTLRARGRAGIQNSSLCPSRCRHGEGKSAHSSIEDPNKLQALWSGAGLATRCTIFPFMMDLRVLKVRSDSITAPTRAASKPGPQRGTGLTQVGATALSPSVDPPRHRGRGLH